MSAIGMNVPAVAQNFFDDTQVNLLNDPRFESGTLAQLRLAPTGAPLGQLAAQSGVLTAPVVEGDYSLTLTSVDDKAYVGIQACVAGDPFSFACDVAFCAGPEVFGILGLEFYDTYGNLLATSTACASTLTPERVEVDAVAPSASAWVAAFLGASGTPPSVPEDLFN